MHFMIKMSSYKTKQAIVLLSDDKIGEWGISMTTIVGVAHFLEMGVWESSWGVHIKMGGYTHSAHYTSYNNVRCYN